MDFEHGWSPIGCVRAWIISEHFAGEGRLGVSVWLPAGEPPPVATRSQVPRLSKGHLKNESGASKKLKCKNVRRVRHHCLFTLMGKEIKPQCRDGVRKISTRSLPCCELDQGPRGSEEWSSVQTRGKAFHSCSLENLCFCTQAVDYYTSEFSFVSITVFARLSAMGKLNLFAMQSG